MTPQHKELSIVDVAAKAIPLLILSFVTLSVTAAVLMLSRDAAPHPVTEHVELRILPAPFAPPDTVRASSPVPRLVTIETDPPGVAVVVGGRVRGKTPLAVPSPVKAGAIRYELTGPYYETATGEAGIALDGAFALNVKLVRKNPASPATYRLTTSADARAQPR